MANDSLALPGALEMLPGSVVEPTELDRLVAGLLPLVGFARLMEGLKMTVDEIGEDRIPKLELIVIVIEELMAAFVLDEGDGVDDELNFGEADREFIEDTANLDDDGPSRELDVTKDEVIPTKLDDDPAEELARPPGAELATTDEASDPVAKLAAFPEDALVRTKGSDDDIEGELGLFPEDEPKAAEEDGDLAV
ncbi:hypothetical protein LTS18_011512, partial [Coniosporium uncinatum]